MFSEKCTMQKVGGLALGLLLIGLLCQPSDARRVDCTKFVFAPICRGVAAKRGITPYFTEDRPPTHRLSNSAALDESAFEEMPDEDAIANRRHEGIGGKKQKQTPLADPVRVYLRMRWSSLRDAVRREEEAENEADNDVISDADYNNDALRGRFQKVYQEARENGDF